MSEHRCSWTAQLSTTPAYRLADYTFTGQFSYMDDPSTSGVTEGFGLMFYCEASLWDNARWYDPSLGRFAQADTIVPGGVQGLDRYAYVNNAPTRFTDPSGHRCVPEDECDTPHGDFPQPDVPLTPPSSETYGGQRMQELYSYLYGAGIVNSPFEFLAWVLLIEANGKSDLLPHLIQIAGQRLWGTHVDLWGHTADGYFPACSSSACANGIFNYIGSYSSSAWFRWDALQDAKASGRQGDFAKVTKDVIYIDTLQSIAGQSADRKKWSYIYDNNTMIHWGAYIPNSTGSDPAVSWVPDMLEWFDVNNIPQSKQLGNGAYQIVWMFKGANGVVDVVYTINQDATWGGLK